MALAIDTKRLVEQWIPREEYIQKILLQLPSFGENRFQLHRFFFFATVHHKHDVAASTISTIASKPDGVYSFEVDHAALDWQADQDVDLDEVEVFHHLKQMAATLALSEDMRQNYSPNAATTLLASAQSPTFTHQCSALVQGRPSSSFRRHSIRRSMFQKCNQFVAYNFGVNRLHRDIYGYSESHLKKIWPWVLCPRVVWASTTENKPAVVWHMQLDYLDLLSPIILPASRLGKRRRTLNPFLQMSPGADGDDTSRVHDSPEAKRFRGVRYRRDRRTWVAEMKPPKWKNKVSFGDFKSQTQAARAVDAALHHYGKPVHFLDTPHILSTRPTPAGLDEKDKLNLVKDQAKWLASMASTLPCTPTSATRATLGFRSSAGTTPLSFGGNDVNEELQRMFQWSMEDAIVDPWSPARTPSSSVHISELWDGPESSSGAPQNFVNSPGVEQACDQIFQRMCMDFGIMSPQAPMFQMESPDNFLRDVLDGLLEQQSFGYE